MIQLISFLCSMDFKESFLIHNQASKLLLGQRQVHHYFETSVLFLRRRTREVRCIKSDERMLEEKSQDAD